MPKLSDTPGEVRWVGPELGEHTDDVLTSTLGKSSEDIDKLREAGVRRVYTPKDFDLTRIMDEIVDVVAESRAAA